MCQTDVCKLLESPLFGDRKQPLLIFLFVSLLVRCFLKSIVNEP